ncbi:MAG: GNAT family N-acetyltransferase [Bacteroidales bacterium]
MNKLLEVNEHLVLKSLQMSDYKAIYHIINSQREYFGQWLPFVEFIKEPNDTKIFIESVLSLPEDKAEPIFTIHYQGHFVGLIGFKSTDRPNQKTEIGYWLSEAYQGKGIISQSVSSLCNFAFTDFGMNRIQIKCALENKRSRLIPERLGFVFEGIERAGELLSGNVFTDLAIYSTLKTQANYVSKK